jgi:hypothetical protein
MIERQGPGGLPIEEIRAQMRLGGTLPQNALVNVLADVVRYSIHPEHRDTTVDGLAEHLK